MLRLFPAAAFLVLIAPVVAGLGGIILPAFGYLPALGHHEFSLAAIPRPRRRARARPLRAAQPLDRPRHHGFRLLHRRAVHRRLARYAYLFGAGAARLAAPQRAACRRRVRPRLPYRAVRLPLPARGTLGRLGTSARSADRAGSAWPRHAARADRQGNPLPPSHGARRAAAGARRRDGAHDGGPRLRPDRWAFCTAFCRRSIARSVSPCWRSWPMPPPSSTSR